MSGRGSDDDIPERRWRSLVFALQPKDNHAFDTLPVVIMLRSVWPNAWYLAQMAVAEIDAISH
jgi:hypothetical protein